MSYEEMEALTETVGRVHRGFTQADMSKVKY